MVTVQMDCLEPAEVVEVVILHVEPPEEQLHPLDRAIQEEDPHPAETATAEVAVVELGQQAPPPVQHRAVQVVQAYPAE